MSHRPFIPPFIVIPMPVDKDGRGPVKEEDAHKIIWEVWDAVNRTVSCHDSIEDAYQERSRITKEYEGVV